ncbi:hypothetical protein FCIRC_10235 [Fusarium circinatum]|uniref:Uncharacterized protein n=1 Tax=Fusarium circinatum TaxID=48490 RepID=A0A8H5TC25_FUSCI|nr:hypothetical protein FCIRC_10235 [Fusarium circinatum]
MHNIRPPGLGAKPLPTQKKALDDKFLFFPYLHQDARLLIWEAALRPLPSKNYNATHHFRVHVWEDDVPSLLETSDVDRNSPPLFGSRVIKERGNLKTRELMANCPEGLKSVVHWDYGLWNACAESRWVISRRFRKKFWEQTKLAILRDWHPISDTILEPFNMEAVWQKHSKLIEGDYLEINTKWYKDFASVVRIGGMYTNIIAVHPAKDLFIVEDDRWMDEVVCQFTDREHEYNAVLLFRENAFSPTNDGFPIMGNIGFVFDDSWSNGITRLDNPRISLIEAKTEDNPRGLFLLLLYLIVVQRLGGMRLWLIDEKFDQCRTCKTKQEAGKEEERERERKVFYRYGKEDLVEVDVKPNVVWMTIDNARCIIATSCGFLEFVSRNPIAFPSTFNPDPRAKPFDIWSCVGVLAPRSRTSY